MRPTLGAAALSCGLFVCAWAADEAALLPATGPLEPRTMERLLLVDAERLGSRIVAVGDRGYVAVSEDQGASWSRAKSPDAPLLTAVDFLDDQTGLAVGHDAVILATADGGRTWSQAFSAPAEQRPLLDVLFATKSSAIAVGAYGAYYQSADGGRTWNPRKVIEDDKHLNAIADLGGGHLLIVGEAGTILVSGDAGERWTSVPSPYKGSFFGAVAAADGAVVAFGLRGRIYRSADKGRTWQQVDNPSVAALMGGERLPDGAIVLAGAAGTALVSRDHGRSFVPVETDTTRALSRAILARPGTLLLIGERGVGQAALASGAARSVP